jgi:hypothetical protein
MNDLDDLISSFKTMAWDGEKNYNDMANSMNNAQCILNSYEPTIEIIRTHLDLAFNRYNYMNKCISFNYDIDRYLQYFLSSYTDKVLGAHSSDFYTLYNVELSYDIDNAIDDLLT